MGPDSGYRLIWNVNREAWVDAYTGATIEEEEGLKPCAIAIIEENGSVYYDENNCNKVSDSRNQ